MSGCKGGMKPGEVTKNFADDPIFFFHDYNSMCFANSASKQ
ncbi:hypothetical protein [Bacillus salipaludis]